MTDPREYVAEETAKSGVPVTIRALRDDDREKVAAAVRGLDRESIYLRLFSYRSELTEAALDRIMRFDPAAEIVLLGTVRSHGDERVIGSARYVVTSTGVAEVAFVVEEDYHGQGIASRLLRHLARVARRQGVHTFEADVLTGNKGMQFVLARAGWPTQMRLEGSSTHITMTLPDDLG
ncbi:MAG: GNAT family N-acetyltransferase [Betaproteobacteria bacterium]